MFEDEAFSNENNADMSNVNWSLNGIDHNHLSKSNAFSEPHHPLQNTLLKINNTLINLWSVLNSETDKRQQRDAWTNPRAVSFYEQVCHESPKNQNDTIHPYMLFNSQCLPKLNKQERSRYQKCLELSNNNDVLAYFFYKHPHLKPVYRDQMVRAFSKYIKRMRSVSYENIWHFISYLSNESNYKASTIDRIYKSWRRVILFWYQLEFDYPQLPKLKIAANKEETKSIDNHDITKAHLELIKNHYYEDALMLHLMFTLKTMPFELRWIRFEDFYESNGKHIINFRHTKAAKLKRVILEESLYREVQNYHNIIKYNKSIYIKDKGTWRRRSS